MVELLISNTDEYEIARFGWGDERQGILHVAGPELGLSQPGIVLVGAELAHLHAWRIRQHFVRHRRLGNDPRGGDANDLATPAPHAAHHDRRPLGFGVTAKDIILAIIAKIGIGGAIGYAIEYAGSTIARMSMNERMTVCNMSIEAGGRAGMIAPDDTTYQFLADRPFAPKGQAWDEAIKFWRTLPTDPARPSARRSSSMPPPSFRW